MKIFRSSALIGKLFRNNALIAATMTLFAVLPASAQDVWHATHTLLPGDIVRDVDVVAQKMGRGTIDPVPATCDVVGQEIKRRVYAGRDLTARDVGPRSAVKANTEVGVLWTDGALSLELQGRALENGALGEEVRVLNPATSRTIRGIVVGDATVEVRSAP
jgi:flagella basal body P-ring formation protein FlgA